MSYLVIVESPAKSKTLAKYLGKDFNVTSSFGHVRSLPSKSGSVIPEKDFETKYEIISPKHSEALIKASSKADKIYLAPDPDREGEAIAWHISEVIKDKTNAVIHRITFNEITKQAVINAINSPREIDLNLVTAQQARQNLDYLVGFTLSPILWRKVPGSKSAGRVQSVALRLICEREYEIKKFTSQEYWSIEGLFESENEEMEAQLTHFKGKKITKLEIKNKKSAQEIHDELFDLEYNVESITKKQIKRNPPPPFITSTIQQEASNKLGFSTKKTMSIAQKLYEGIDIKSEVVGLITYMRTDGLYVSDSAIKETRETIENLFGKKYVADKIIKYTNKVKNAQEAHEAIRPTSSERTPEILKSYLTQEQLQLYQLIWNRMLASQMKNAVLDQVTIDIKAKNSSANPTFRSTGSVLSFDGFYRIAGSPAKDKLLPKMEENSIIILKKVNPKQHFTQPPPRYTEATLVKKMEELGIGRPSTYSTIISVIQTREYVKLENKRFWTQDKGVIVNIFLTNFFPKYIEYSFTADLEKQLDAIALGNMNWKFFLKNFWSEFIDKIEETNKIQTKDVIENITKYIKDYLIHKDESLLCPDCQKQDILPYVSKFGVLWKCTECGYRSDKKIIGYTDNQEQILLKNGPYGPYIEANEKKWSVPEEIKDIDEKLAKQIMSLPNVLGQNPETSSEIKRGIGPYGAYVLHEKKYHSVKPLNKIFDITIKDAMEIINKPQKRKVTKTKETDKQ